MRIIYGSPPSNEPSGGVKVIYRHCEVLNTLGVPSFVWVPSDPGFSCNWFDHGVRHIATEELNPKNDFIVLPEIWASYYVGVLKSLGFRVAIFVQNAYLTHVNLNPNNRHGIRDAYRDADLVLSISVDTSRYLIDIVGVPSDKIIGLRYTVNRTLFHPVRKERLVTYMPRKMSDHAARVVSLLSDSLPHSWNIVPLDKLSERQVAAALSKSIIFLAFSEFEGLPVPPVEAALSGNLVIGYHGQGGREYWRRPNFVEIDQGDIQRFIFETNDMLNIIGSGQLDIEALNDGIEYLGKYFSEENELSMLKTLVHSMTAFFSEG